MSAELIMQFKTKKEKKKFLSLFDDYKKHPFSDTVFITFAYDLEKNPEGPEIATQMDFDTHWEKRSVYFEYKGESLLVYYLALAISERYDVKMYWGSGDAVLKDGKEFFKTKDGYNGDFLAHITYKSEERALDLSQYEGRDPEKDSFLKRIY